MEFYLDVAEVAGSEARFIYEVVEPIIAWETPVDYGEDKMTNTYMQFRGVDGNWPLRWRPYMHRYLKRGKGRWGDKVSLEYLEALGFSPMTEDELQRWFDSTIIYDGVQADGVGRSDFVGPGPLSELSEAEIVELYLKDNPTTLLIIPALFAMGLVILYVVR
jgi:hypothetical protein